MFTLWGVALSYEYPYAEMEDIIGHVVIWVGKPQHNITCPPPQGFIFFLFYYVWKIDHFPPNTHVVQYKSPASDVVTQFHKQKGRFQKNIPAIHHPDHTPIIDIIPKHQPLEIKYKIHKYTLYRTQCISRLCRKWHKKWPISQPSSPEITMIVVETPQLLFQVVASKRSEILSLSSFKSFSSSPLVTRMHVACALFLSDKY